MSHDRRTADPIGVYVHFPWCLQKCPYCDFATTARTTRDIPHEAFANAVLHELELRTQQFPQRGPLTVYFGGGTPSLWNVDSLARVFRTTEDTWGTSLETTVECNPTSLTSELCEALHAHGIDRLSVGVQSLRDPHLRYLGRLHDAAGALRAVEVATRSANFRVSADLMLGMPDQTIDELLGDAQSLLNAGVDHLSIYALTVEPNTRFGELARKGRLHKMQDDHVADLLLALASFLRERGLEQYEISNYARPGFQAVHNANYWRGHAYVGLGPGAVGCMHNTDGSAVRYRNLPGDDDYLAHIHTPSLPPHENEDLDIATRVREALMLGLRTTEGVDVARLQDTLGVEFRVGRERAVERAISRGDLVITSTHWTIPTSRWLLADEIISRLF